MPASLGLILASEEIINALFGYGSFSKEDVKLTADALKYFGYGVPAFSLVKILSNFFFARDNTKTPFYISLGIVAINISISVSLFSDFGFIIIPIATSIATWLGVLVYIYLLNKKNSLLLKIEFIPNLVKILCSTIIMSFILTVVLDNYASYLDYTYKFKAIYLISIVGFTGIVYLLSCYLLGILKIKKYKTN
jgi:putative peptidoglycan lipid II flippase